MATRTLVRSFHALFGAAYLLAGAAVLLLGTGLLPDPVRDLINAIARDTPNTLHVMQEFGSLLVFVGLITFWFVWHYDQSRPFHWAMTVFWGLLALIHWFDIRGPFPSAVGPLINSVPFALFLAVGLFRAWAEAKAPVAAGHLGGATLERRLTPSPVSRQP
jgi:hypothetical protein